MPSTRARPSAHTAVVDPAIVERSGRLGAPLSDLHAKQIDGDSGLLVADLCGPQHYATDDCVTSIVHRPSPLNLPPILRRTRPPTPRPLFII
ncbi:hypothetical protein J6590_008395 [Homalodisca vitripennis]|nr:hypothetical protein J6590_008395 [Homalodisca vitripennis]